MFHCKHCLVQPVCSELCEDINKRDRAESSNLIKNNICPDCGTENNFITYVRDYCYHVRCKQCKHYFSMLGGYLSRRSI